VVETEPKEVQVRLVVNVRQLVGSQPSTVLAVLGVVDEVATVLAVTEPGVAEQVAVVAQEDPISPPVRRTPGCERDGVELGVEHRLEAVVPVGSHLLDGARCRFVVTESAPGSRVAVWV
jgi:hypothetical protein